MSAPSSLNQTPQTGVRFIFVGPYGIRAGWRLLIFAAMMGIPFGGLYWIGKVYGNAGAQPIQVTAGLTIVGECFSFLFILFVSWLMTLIEGRKIADYGLPIRKAFGKEFWQGAVIGFAAMTVLLAMLRLAGVFSFGAIGLHGATLAEYAVLWAVAFLFVGFNEEFLFRGYAQFTATTGIGFWPAAILLSAAFGAVHLGNGGEDWIGALSVFGSGLLFCLILRRTGSLWMPIGFHMAWDWAETFFYGVPDSGLSAPGHMLNPNFHGPKLLTGGTVGPEGSVLVFVILALCWLFFHLWLPEAKYPNPASLVPKPHRTSTPEAASSLSV